MSELVALIQFAQQLRVAADEFLTALGEVAELEPEPVSNNAKKPTLSRGIKKTVVATEEPESADDDDDDEDSADSRLDELMAMRITALRSLAIKRGFDEEETKNEKSKSVLANAIWADEQANPEDDDSDPDSDDEDADTSEDESDDSEEEGARYTREDLQQMGLRQLKALAKNSGIEPAELRGKDSDSIIDMLLVDEDEDDADDDDDVEDDSEEGFYTEADLKKMSVLELKTLAKDNEITVPRTVGNDKLKLVKLLLENAE